MLLTHLTLAHPKETPSRTKGLSYGKNSSNSYLKGRQRTLYPFPILIYGLQHHNVTENAAKTAQQQSPGLQQESTCSNVAAVVTERKKQKILLTLEGFRSAETSSKIFSTPLPTLK